MISEQSRFPNDYLKTRIFLKSRVGNEIAGIMVHDAVGKAWSFNSLLELLKLYERIFDSVNYPQSTMAMRSFSENSVLNGSGAVPEKEVAFMNETHTEKPTFIVKIQYRQNASWQGTIKWIEGDLQKSFRSTLEMIRLMDEAVGSENDTGW